MSKKNHNLIKIVRNQEKFFRLFLGRVFPQIDFMATWLEKRSLRFFLQNWMARIGCCKLYDTIIHLDFFFWLGSKSWLAFSWPFSHLFSAHCNYANWCSGFAWYGLKNWHLQKMVVKTYIFSTYFFKANFSPELPPISHTYCEWPIWSTESRTFSWK